MSHVPEGWPNSEPHRKTFRVSTPVHGMTVADMLVWCTTNGYTPDEVRLTSGHVIHERTETTAEAVARQQRAQQSYDAHCAYIAKRYKELFGEPDTGA